MNIYRFELKSLRKNTIIWTCSLFALAALYLSLYPSIAKDATDFKNLLSGYPQAVRDMLGIQLDYISTLLGFYSMIFAFILLGGSIQAMNLGLSMLSKESRERTADFLLVKPISRTSITTYKLLASFTSLVFTNVVFFLASFLLANAVKTESLDFKLFLMVNVILLFIQIIFFSLGLVISVFFKTLKNVLPLSLGVVFGLYMIGSLLATGDDADIVRYFSPFKYFDIIYIITHGRYEVSYLLTGLIISVLSIAASYIIYNKKDIHAVS